MRHLYILVLIVLIGDDKFSSWAAPTPDTPVPDDLAPQTAATTTVAPRAAATTTVAPKPSSAWRKSYDIMVSAARMANIEAMRNRTYPLSKDSPMCVDLPNELRLEGNVVPLDDTSSNETYNEALPFVGGSFSIPKGEFQVTDETDGELTLKFNRVMRPMTVQITNSWNSEKVKEDLLADDQVIAPHVFLPPLFFQDMEDAVERTVKFVVAGFQVSAERRMLMMTSLKPYLLINSKKSHLPVIPHSETSVRCKDLPLHLQDHCCIEDLVIDFAEFGWNDWIVAPPSVNIKRCRGSCRITEPAGLWYGQRNHCCIPSTFGSFKALYIDHNDKVMLKTYRETTVESCHCA